MWTEDFEVSIFLTETDTRHSLLTKQKHFRDLHKKGIQSNSNKLTGGTTDTAIEVEDAPVIRREESEDDEVDLQDLPAAEELPTMEEDISDAGSLFVDDDDDEDRQAAKRPRAATDASASEASATEPDAKRRKDSARGEEDSDDKKKMAMTTTYEGFAIYGRVLCLVVKRKGSKGKAKERDEGQAMMEDWITSTQMPAGAEEEGT